MVKPSLILHIGTEKTGTTSLQEFLALNRDMLNNQGILYPKSLGKKNHIKLAAYAANTPSKLISRLALDSDEKRREFRVHLEQQFRQELAVSQCEHVIISNEHLHSRITDLPQIADIKELLDNYFFSVKILVYFRRQDLMAVSRRSTAIKSGFMLLDPFQQSQAYYYNFYHIYKNWRDVFGKENMIVRIFAKEHFKNKNLFDDFCFNSSITNTKEFLVPKRQNEALSLEAELLILELNRRINNGLLDLTEPDRKQLIAEINRHYDGLPHYPDRLSAICFYQQFTASNKALAKLLKDFPATLFNDDFSMYPEHQDVALLKEKRRWARKELSNLLA